MDEQRKLITEDHVKAALTADKGKSARLTSWEIKDFTKKGDNYGSLVTSVMVKYSIGGESRNTSYVVKVNVDGESGFEDLQPFNQAIFHKEAEFLAEIAPALDSELAAVGQEPLRLPKQYHCSLVKNKELLFLEDLRVRGFKMVDSKKGLDAPHALLVFKELARLHAASVSLQWKHPEEDLAEKYKSLNIHLHNHSEKAEKVFNIAYSPGFKGSLNILKKVGGYEVAEKWLADNKNKCFDIYKKHIIQKAPFIAICHGDCWSNNILFRYDEEGNPEEVMLLDLQLSHVVSPANELAFFLTTSFLGDVRESNLENFLMTYYTTFRDVIEGSKTNKMPFTYDELVQEYKDKLEYGLLFFLFFADSLVKPPEEVMEFSVSSEEQFKQLMEDWHASSLDYVDKSPLFKARFTAVFDHLIKNGAFDK